MDGEDTYEFVRGPGQRGGGARNSTHFDAGGAVCAQQQRQQQRGASFTLSLERSSELYFWALGAERVLVDTTTEHRAHGGRTRTNVRRAARLVWVE